MNRDYTVLLKGPDGEDITVPITAKTPMLAANAAEWQTGGKVDCVVLKLKCLGRCCRCDAQPGHCR